MRHKPLKRARGLRPLSIDHHHGLLLCWKIRAGVHKDIAADRIWAYVEWFFTEHLAPHFTLEEKQVFPLLGNDHPMVRRALAEHREIRGMVGQRADTPEGLIRLADILQGHIRFEERTLFDELQKTASEQQLHAIEQLHHGERFTENSKDFFWE